VLLAIIKGINDELKNVSNSQRNHGASQDLAGDSLWSYQIRPFEELQGWTFSPDSGDRSKEFHRRKAFEEK
jgi:hypothetical protein